MIKLELCDQNLLHNLHHPHMDGVRCVINDFIILISSITSKEQSLFHIMNLVIQNAQLISARDGILQGLA